MRIASASLSATQHNARVSHNANSVTFDTLSVGDESDPPQLSPLYVGLARSSPCINHLITTTYYYLRYPTYSV